tara:strand:+ start:1973 stop:2902 length:930 start_codon:yes stop_codon:yes gene_type:complete
MSSINRKGIILAGGNGKRLYPITCGISKQLIPVFDKPMIYYPLGTLMLAGIRDILIITKEEDEKSFQRLLGNGNQWGINICYKIQASPDGLAQAFLIGEEFIGDSPVALILGDNLFHGSNLTTILRKANNHKETNTIFAYPVNDPERYGVVVFDKEGKALNIEEKPINPKSKFAITGLYFYDQTIIKKARKVLPSSRGELEITSINQMYLEEGNLKVEMIGRGMAWLDTGTFDSLQQAGSYIRTLEKRQGLKICCPEEISWRQGWISNNDLNKIAKKYLKSGYGDYLINLLKETEEERLINNEQFVEII